MLSASKVSVEALGTLTSHKDLALQAKQSYVVLHGVRLCRLLLAGVEALGVPTSQGLGFSSQAKLRSCAAGVNSRRSEL